MLSRYAQTFEVKNISEEEDFSTVNSSSFWSREIENNRILVKGASELVSIDVVVMIEDPRLAALST